MVTATKTSGSGFTTLRCEYMIHLDTGVKYDTPED